jgi:hypothetical protein
VQVGGQGDPGRLADDAPRAVAAPDHAHLERRETGDQRGRVTAEGDGTRARPGATVRAPAEERARPGSRRSGRDGGAREVVELAAGAGKSGVGRARARIRFATPVRRSRRQRDRPVAVRPHLELRARTEVDVDRVAEVVHRNGADVDLAAGVDLRGRPAGRRRRPERQARGAGERVRAVVGTVDRARRLARHSPLTVDDDRRAPGDGLRLRSRRGQCAREQRDQRDAGCLRRSRAEGAARSDAAATALLFHRAPPVVAYRA